MTNKNRINEATSDSSIGGKFQIPLSPGLRFFKKQDLQPFIESDSKYDSAELAYDSYDGKMSTPKNEIKKKESLARKVSNYNKKHPRLSDSDGDILNNEPIKEMTDKILKTLREDLAVWFGTKKKPKGSKQPKGPWVNICRKKEGGGHPPCGRPEASSKGYPKCRAAGVASKMTDAQKRSACQQKRRAEKTKPKTGTGNKPTMVSYKPKKKKTNESSLVNLFRKLILEQIDGQTYSKKDLIKLLDKNKYNNVPGTRNLSMGKEGNYKVYSSVGETQSAAQMSSSNKAKNPMMKFEYFKKLDDGNFEFLVIVFVN